MLKINGKELAGKTVAVSGSGNVAIYATEKAQELGAKVVTVSDSTGWVYDPEGIDLAALKEIKEVNRARLTEYKKYRPNSEYHEGKGVWSVKVDIALPCATQNELHLEDAEMLVANGCMAVAEALICRLRWKQQNTFRRTESSSHREKQQMQAVSQHLLWKCPRTASA